MKVKITLMVLALGPVSIGLAGCSHKTAVYNTPANAMPLVKTGVGEIQSTNKSTGKNNPNLYNANTANIAEVEKEDLTKVEFMPTGYEPIGGDTKGGPLTVGISDNSSNTNSTTNTNTGTKNQSQNANKDTVNEQRIKETLASNEKTAVNGAKQDAGDDGFKNTNPNAGIENKADRKADGDTGKGYNNTGNNDKTSTYYNGNEAAEHGAD